MDKKNCGILTFYNTTNYGALLQMYALYKCVSDMGVSVEIIKYSCKAVEERENLKLRNAKSLKQLIRILILIFPNTFKQRKFRSFENKYFKFSEKVYDIKNNNMLGEAYERIIVGSDQVWNLKLTGEDYGFFLKGVAGVQKYSYAASFGRESIDENELDKIKPLLNDFDYIAVRESSGQEIVKSCIGKKAEFVLDPTFLFKPEQWKELGNCDLAKDGSYILLYLIQNKKKTIEYAQKLAKKNRWKIKYINISPYHVRGVENIRSASPEEFLGLISGAKVVITGSYHGLALSVNLSKPVYYELNGNANNYNARISSLISALDLQSCKLDYSIDELPFIDYITVQAKLNEYRERSMKTLRAMLNDMDVG